MTAPDRTLEDRADAYLDGDLARDEALVFERDLAVRPELAAALAAALALRELLVALPPVAPPPELGARIAASLRLELRRARQDPAAARERPPLAAHAVLGGLSWALRAPAFAARGAATTAIAATHGMSSVRWALGPLAPSAPPPAPRRPLWQRVLLGRRKA